MNVERKKEKSYGNKNFKRTIPSTGGDRSKTAVECGKNFNYVFWQHDNK